MTNMNILRNRGKCFFAFCCLSFFVLVFIAMKVTDKPAEWISEKYFTSRAENIDFRRETAKQLHDILTELKRQYEINPHLIFKLNSIVSQLDPQYSISDQDLTTSWNHNKIFVSENTADVCPEIFLSTRYGRKELFQKGFIVSPTCDLNSKKPLNKLVTVLLNMVNDIEIANSITNVVEKIRKYNSLIPIIIAVYDDSDYKLLNITKQLAEKYSVKFIKYSKKYISKPGIVWNNLIAKSATPYSLLGRDLVNFNSYAKLERQIYVISDSDYVKIAGGSFRNTTGHWKVGCYQSEIKNYNLRYTEGYRYSAYDCMFCDYLEGPFIADTKFLVENPFNHTLSSEALFYDWFLKVKYDGVLTLNCPDVMYFISGMPVSSMENMEVNNRQALLALAKKWEIHKISFSPNIVYSFSCKEAGLSCELHQWVKSYLVPPCCFVQIKKALKALDNFTKDKGLRYELDSGSLLGAVKLRSFMPWDVDGDINFVEEDYEIFFENKKWFHDKGLKLDSFRPRTKKSVSYFKIRTPDIYYEMWGTVNFTDVFLPDNIREIPTKVQVLGLWVNGQANPALYARNRYGPNYLKHVQHWGYLDKKDSWQLYNPGSWLKCPKPQHHACLDHYPVDGNIDFIF